MQNEPQEVKIGKLTIYPNQISTAKKIIEHLECDSLPPCLIAEPQEGKTGVVIYLADWAIKECNKNNKKAYIFCLCNISDNDLRSQTKDRFREANLVGPSFIPEEHFQHRGGNGYENLIYIIEDIKKDKNAVIYVFVDECHEALNKKNANGMGAKFFELTRALGVKYGQPKFTWDNQNIHFLSISATLFPQLANGNFNFISLEKDEKNPYLGMGHLIENDRMREVKSPIIKKNAITEFGKHLFEEYFEIIRKKKGHMIIRQNNPHILKDFLEKNYKKEFAELLISCKIYNNDNQNIKELEEDLGYFNGEDLKIFLISGSMRAGKTLKNSEHIRMWVDRCSTPSATIQSIGRLCGRKSVRKDDDCIYYGNPKHIKQALKHYQSPKDFIPESKYNKGCKIDIKGQFEYVFEKETISEMKKLKDAHPNKTTSTSGIQFKTLFKMIGKNLPNILQNMKENKSIWVIEKERGGNTLMNGKDYYFINNYPKCFDKKIEDLIKGKEHEFDFVPTQLQWEEAKNNWVSDQNELFASHFAELENDCLVVSKKFFSQESSQNNMKESVMPTMYEQIEQIENCKFPEKLEISPKKIKKNRFVDFFNKFNLF